MTGSLDSIAPADSAAATGGASLAVAARSRIDGGVIVGYGLSLVFEGMAVLLRFLLSLAGEPETTSADDEEEKGKSE